VPSICFFIAAGGESRNDNHRRLPAAFASAGWRVHAVDHEDLCLHGNVVTLADGTALDDFDLIWPIGLGHRETFLDRMQILSRLPPQKFAVAPTALLGLHAKYALPLGALSQHHPETHASRDSELLAALVAKGGEWIAKPPASSFGRDVYRLRHGDPNLRVILSALTGHDGSRYCLLQRYVPEIENGETRVLIAGGRIIAAYLRRPHSDHRANLATHALAETTALSADERTLAQACAEWLAAEGVHWAAVDIAHPWIIEFNIANPGGLETIERLTGIDHSRDVVAAMSVLLGS